jgi:hypothetical protein
MKTTHAVESDERTVAVTNAICTRAYFFLTFALYIDMLVRVFAFHEAPWDLMALVVGTSVVCAICLIRRGAASRKGALCGAVFGVIFGVILAAVLLITRPM